jgi:membrane protein involved in colicin uptake
VTGILLAAVVAVLLAVSYPTTFAAVATGAVGGSVVTAVAVGSRRRTGRTRTLRVPGTDVSVEA